MMPVYGTKQVAGLLPFTFAILDQGVQALGRAHQAERDPGQPRQVNQLSVTIPFPG
jgi:hypothetical protein